MSELQGWIVTPDWVGSNEDREMSDKELAIRTLMLLSALESWAYSVGKPLPAHMSNELDVIIKELKSEVLK